MGLIKAEIELVRGNDLALVEEGYMKPEEVRSVIVEALVDSGAYMLVINEQIKAQLSLKSKRKQVASLADGSKKELDVVGPIEVRFKTRSTVVEALVVPGDAEVLLGAIPMEGMDVIIDPLKQELRLPPSRPYVAQTILKRIKNCK